MLLPITLTADIAVQVGFGMLLPAVAIVQPFVAPVRRDVYDSAREAFAKGRYEEARAGFRAIVFAWDDDSPYDPFPREYIDLSLYYLGVSDQMVHDDRGATEAFDRFLSTGTWRGEAPYRDAEARLARLEPKRVPACRSQAEVHLTWRRPS